MRRVKRRGPGPSQLVGDARSCGQRGRDRSAQAHAERDGRRCARRDPRLGSLSRLGRGSPRARGVGAAVRADRPLGDRGAASWGRHTAMFLAGRGHDVRDVCANRTPRADRARQRGKSDTLDSRADRARGARAPAAAQGVQARRTQTSGPDEQHQLLALWNNRRRSILTGRQHLVGEAEYLLCELPLELREQLPDTKAVRPRLAALARRNRRRRYDAPTRLRLQLLDSYRAQIKTLDREERQVVAASSRRSLTRAARRLASSAA